MTTVQEYSSTNILNSVSTYLSAKLLADGMLVYWHAADALQIDSTSTGWYVGFSANRASILANATVAAALAASRGIITILTTYPAEPRFIHRLISDASWGATDVVPVPAMTVDVTPVQRTTGYELGTRKKWRPRAVLIELYARDQNEQSWLSDWVERAVEQDQHISVVNHDDGSLAVVGDAVFEQVRVETDTYLDAADALAFQVVAGAYLVYVV